MLRQLAIAIAVTSLLPSAGRGQTPGTDDNKLEADVQKDRADLAKDHAESKDLEQDRNAAFKSLREKEAGAAEAIRKDSTLTDAQKKEKLAALRADFKAQKETVQRKFVADKKALTKDAKHDRRDLHKDERELRRDHHEDRMERHEGHGRHGKG
jgi:hypothetical protein